MAAASMYDDTQTILWLRLGSGAFLILLVGYAVFRRRRQDERRRRWSPVRGTVVDENWTGYGAGGDSSYTPVVAFRTTDGVEVHGSPRGGMYLGMPIVGREVPVWYDPADPQKFEARIYALDRDGSMALLIAIVPAVLFFVSWLP
jgi:hypothetical protein